jgi:hypothetical protein
MLRSSGTRSILPSDVAGADHDVLLLPALFCFPQPVLLQLDQQPKPSRVTPSSSRLVNGTQIFIAATGDAAPYFPRRIRARERDNPRDNDDGPVATRRGAISSEVELRFHTTSTQPALPHSCVYPAKQRQGPRLLRMEMDTHGHALHASATLLCTSRHVGAVLLLGGAWLAWLNPVLGGGPAPYLAVPTKPHPGEMLARCASNPATGDRLLFSEGQCCILIPLARSMSSPCMPFRETAVPGVAVLRPPLASAVRHGSRSSSAGRFCHGPSHWRL